MEEKKISGLSLLTFPFLKKYGLFCGFTSRNDTGYSKEPYNSLNLAYHVGDDSEDVKRNRELVACKISDMGSKYLYSARQTHGKNVIYVTEETIHEDGNIDRDADGLMTDRKGLAVMVMGADCSLMVAADVRSRAVCAVHAGWKGTLNGMLGTALKKLSGKFGSAGTDINIFMGPAIRQCCYEIGDELAVRFRSRFGSGDHLVKRNGSWYLDLAALNRRQALGFGIPDKNIYDTGICTCCDSRYYSYRREGVTGRHAAIAMVM